MQAGRKRQWDGALLVAFAKPEDHGAAPLPQDQVLQFEVDQIGHTTAGVQKQSEDRRRTNVLP